MSKKLTIEDVDLTNKSVLVRVDFNVPFKPGSTDISDLTRIESSLPTIRYLLHKNCKVVLCSHLGRPEGRPDEALSLRPIAFKLEELLGMHVGFVNDCVSDEAVNVTSEMTGGDIVLLENLRFHSAEEANDSEFARKLANLAEFYVNDAFGVSHRTHASISRVTEYIPGVLGFLFNKEVDSLSGIFQCPVRPFTAILGGSKISDKIKVVERISGLADDILIGGGMAATFIKSLGHGVGNSSVEYEYLDFAKWLLSGDRNIKSRVWLAEDVVVGRDFSSDSEHKNYKISDINERGMILDIGLGSISKFRQIIENSRTVFWNGPMGVFEWDSFAIGSKSVATAMASQSITSVIGGGSTVEAVSRFGLRDKMSHVSTGGGASLQFLEGRGLPGLDAIFDRSN